MKNTLKDLLLSGKTESEIIAELHKAQFEIETEKNKNKELQKYRDAMTSAMINYINFLTNNTLTKEGIKNLGKSIESLYGEFETVIPTIFSLPTKEKKTSFSKIDEDIIKHFLDTLY